MVNSGELVLELFVRGQSARSDAAVELVRHVCETRLQPGYRLEVIDIHQQPERTRDAAIMATPALIRRHPEPVLRLTGCLTEKRILENFGIPADHG